MYKLITLLLLLFCFVFYKSSKTPTKTDLQIVSITNYLPNPIKDSIPISGETFAFNLYKITSRQNEYLINADHETLNKRVITYEIDSILDNNNDILSRNFSKYEFAHDIYTTKIRFLLAPKSSTFVKTIKGTFYECKPSKANGTKIIVEDFTNPEKLYKNLLESYSAYDNKMFIVNKEVIKNIKSKDAETLKLLVANKILKSLDKSDVNFLLAKINFALNSSDRSKNKLKVIDRINSGETVFFIENNKYEVLESTIINSTGKKVESLKGMVRPQYGILFLKNQFEEYKINDFIIELANKKSLTLHNFELNNIELK